MDIQVVIWRYYSFSLGCWFHGRNYASRHASILFKKFLMKEEDCKKKMSDRWLYVVFGNVDLAVDLGLQEGYASSASYWSCCVQLSISWQNEGSKKKFSCGWLIFLVSFSSLLLLESFILFSWDFSSFKERKMIRIVIGESRGDILHNRYGLFISTWSIINFNQ